MKVLLLHYAAPPIIGGVESVLGHQARLIAANGHKVMIAAGRGAQRDANIIFQPLAILDSRHPAILKSKQDLDAGRVPENFEQLVKEITTALSPLYEWAEVVIAHNVCSLAKNLPLTAALWQLHTHAQDTRLILWHHDLAWTTPRYRAELHNGYPWDLLRRDWPNARQVVVSRMRQQELAQLLGVELERIAVVPNGLDFRQFLKLEPQTIAWIEQFNLLEAQPLLLLPVRITPRKNLELALRILAALRRDFPRARLIITGPLGPHNPANVHYFEGLVALRRELQLQETAIFLAEQTEEHIPDTVITDFYRLADALLMPSREEGFGIPMLEAGLAGLPIFCTGIPPLKELGGEEATYFSPDAEPARIARQIAEQLHTDRSYRMRVRVRSGYNWQNIYQRHIAPLLGV